MTITASFIGAAGATLYWSREEDISALSKSSGLDGAQVKEAFDAFVAEYPNGRIKPKNFRKM